MALARKCDRCGKFYDNYNMGDTISLRKTNGIMFINVQYNNKYYSCKKFDLCPVCKDTLVDWFLDGMEEE